MLASEGMQWTHRAEEFAQVTMICAECYDNARARNAVEENPGR